MANNVQFKKGLQAAFDKLQSFEAGSFYLTTDTGRIYFASDPTEAKYLNKYIQTYASETALRADIAAKKLSVGDFAYVTAMNALVVITPSGFNQVNPDHNDNTKVTGLTFEKNVNDDTDTITFNFNLTQANGNQAETPITGSFQITAADVRAVIPAPSVSVGATVGPNKATVNVAGEGASGAGFTISGKGSAVVSGTTNNITIEATNTTYTLDSAASSNKITLTDNDAGTSEVEIAAGTAVSIDGSTAGKIVVNHGNVSANKTTSTQSPAMGDTVTMVDSVTTNAQGHVTGINTKTVTLPRENPTVIKSVTTNATNGTIAITYGDKDGAGTTVTSNPGLFVKVGKGGKTQKFIGNDLGVYTIEEIDQKMRTLDAMVYKGTVGGAGATVATLPTSGVQNGDTYKVAQAGNYGGQTGCDIGDLLIASGTEDSSGVIPTESLKWTYIPAGDDTDTHYALSVDTSANAGVINLKQTDGNPAGTATIKGDKDIVVGVTGSTISVGHKTFNAPTGSSGTPSALKAGSKFTAMTAVTTDNGHVTGYQTTQFTLPQDADTHYTLEGASNKITLRGSDNATSELTVTSGTGATATVSGNTLTVSHAPYTSNTSGTAEVETAPKGKFTAITAIGLHENGHVKNITTTTYTLPAQKTYSLSNPVCALSGNTITATTTLTDNDGQVSKSILSLTSSSLKLNSAGANSFSVELEWGEF